MSIPNSNPPQESSDFGMPPKPKVGKDFLAGRGTRLAAAIIDGILIMLINGPIQYSTGYFERQMAQDASVLEALGMAAIGFLVFALIQGYLLYSRGQTVGKMLLGIQIVDFNSGYLLPFVRIFVLRYLWLWPVSIITLLIPGQFDDIAVGLISIVDSLMIFSEQRRCLHDHIAGSIVVEYQEGRERLG